jgi:pSer/pThr/pTyr-binding forkhead associated (FHA) protein
MSVEVNGELIPAGGGDTIPLIHETLTIGRRETCDIPLRYPNVSGLHAELSFKDGYWYIRDLNSTNGVKVNGLRVQQKLLHPGDEITIAKRRYTLQYTLMAGRRAMEEIEEDILSQSLLERAGLEKPRPSDEDRRPKHFDPSEFLLSEDDEEK